MLPLLQTIGEELTRRALTDEAANWFASLVWSTRLVVIGVLGEGIAVVHEIVGVVKQWFRTRKERADLEVVRALFPVSDTIIGTESESRVPTWVKLVAFLGLIAVAIGVAGEWRYEVKFEAATAEIQTFDGNRVTEANKNAGDAATSAKGAAEAASEATASADALKTYLAQLATPREIILSDRDGDHEERAARFAEVQKYPGTVAVTAAYGRPGIPQFQAFLKLAGISNRAGS
jgi:hypothetical protein